ncbi:hypothetical protein [Roseibium suaedae]|uniref:hypothetical protein n=1 Tax=Roseibium suaedae TaxID=735517 RepID=UPI001114B40F|nr:hypothetical protein [Roseibium suaedae]
MQCLLQPEEIAGQAGKLLPPGRFMPGKHWKKRSQISSKILNFIEIKNRLAVGMPFAILFSVFSGWACVT